MRKPTEAERRAIQHAVDAGDWDRARELLAAVKRRVTKSKTRRSGPQTSAKRGRAATKRRVSPRAGGAASKPAPAARKKATPKPPKKKAKLPSKRCTRCGEQFRPTSGRQLRCSVCSPSSSSTSVRTVSGGLPGLGKRR